MKTFNHNSKRRERVMNPQDKKQLTGRALRRQQKRDERKALATLASHDPRAVKFHF